jgi:hypothetical protein
LTLFNFCGERPFKIYRTGLPRLKPSKVGQFNAVPNLAKLIGAARASVKYLSIRKHYFGSFFFFFLKETLSKVFIAVFKYT